MDPFVFGLVLLAAAFHASWNALIKIRLDPFLAIVLIAAMAGIASLPLLLFVPIPPLAAWPWLIASVITHVGYYIGLAGAYRSGDMGQVYPIARGTAPLMTAAGGALLVGENFSLTGWAGIVALTGGVFLLSLRGGGDLAHLNRRAVGYALFTAVTICFYSLVDGIGARTAGNAHSYALWLFVIDGAFITLIAHRQPRARRRSGHGPILEKRPGRRRPLADRLLDRDLGNDRRADRARCRTARDQRAVRRRDRGRVPERAAASAAHFRRHADRLRDRADPAAVTHPGEVPHRTPRGHIVPRMSGHRVCRNGRGTARCRRGAWDRGADCLRFRTIC